MMWIFRLIVACLVFYIFYEKGFRGMENEFERCSYTLLFTSAFMSLVHYIMIPFLRRMVTYQQERDYLDRLYKEVARNSLESS